MAEYVKIYCCGDCIYYDWKKHKCKRGAKDDDGSRFFRDCPIGIHEEKDGERVDAVPVKHGRWTDKDGGIATCSVCGDRWGVWSVMKYCPSCGAKMDGKDGDDGTAEKTEKKV